MLKGSGTRPFLVCKLNGTLASQRIWQNTSWTKRKGGSIKESDAKPEGCKKVVDKVLRVLGIPIAAGEDVGISRREEKEKVRKLKF